MSDATMNSVSTSEMDGANVVRSPGTVEWQMLAPDTVGNRPAAGTANRLFYATDEQTWYRDTGSAWQALQVPELAAVATSRIIGRVTAGSGASEELTAAQVKTLLAVAFSDLSGSIADGQVPESAVTQHEGAVDHDGLTNFAADEHRKLLVDTVGNRPAAGTANRFFWATDEKILYRDTGSTWDAVTPAAVTEAAVTAHEAALTILESQITDAGLLARAADDETISGDYEFTGNPDFPAMGVYNIMHVHTGGGGAGAVSGDTGDQTAEIQAAIDAAEAAGGGIVFVPEGTFRCTSDLTVDSSNVIIMGTGYGSTLHMVNARLHLDGEAAYVERGGLERLRVLRDGGAGVAVDITGGGSGTGFVRFKLDKVFITSTGGTGLRLAGSQIGAFHNLIIQNCTTGMVHEVDPVAGNLFAPGMFFFGGEIQSCGTAATITGAAGLSFHGMIFEGCSAAGVDLVENCRGVGFYGCYWEQNAGYDIRIGNGTSSSQGIDIRGCYFADGNSAKDHSISLIRALDTIIEANRFSGYAAEAVDVQEASADAVTGRAMFNYEDGTGIVALNGAGSFDVLKIGGTEIIGNDLIADGLDGIIIQSGGLIKSGDGNAGAAAFSFTLDTDTGLFRPGANRLAFGTGGTKAGEINASQELEVDTTIKVGASLREVGITSSMFAGSASLSGGQTRYVHYGIASAAEAGAQMPVPFDCVARNLRVFMDAAPGSGESLVATLRDDGGNTSLTATVSDTNTTASDLANSPSIAAGSLICIKLVASNNGGYAGGRVNVACELVQLAD